MNNNIVHICCVSFVIGLMAWSGCAHASTAEISYSFEGIALDTGEKTQDPTILVVLFSQSDAFENAALPEQCVPEIPEADAPFEFSPVSDAPLRPAIEQALQFASAATETTLLDPLFFQSFDSGDLGIAVRPDDILAVNMPRTQAPHHSLREDSEDAQTVDAVPEPAAGLLVGVGIVLIGVFARRKRRTLLVMAAFTAGMTVSAHEAAAVAAPASRVVTITKEGDGTGLLVAGTRVCDFLCDTLRVPYTKHAAETLKVVPDADSIFVGWKQANGEAISGAVHAQPGDALIAALTRRPGAQMPLYAGHQAIVRLKPGANAKTVAALKQRVGFIAADALTLRDKLWYVTTTTENALTILKASPAVAYAEPDYVVTAADATPTEFDNNPTLPSYGADAWWLRKINAPAAWDISAGGETILAVLDTGVDYTHSDVKKNMWVNPNGASDGLHGYDFVDGDPDPMDVGGHGTHVAGILGARANNGGVVGVNWRTNIMAIRVLKESEDQVSPPYGLISRVIEGIRYARSHGANIVNNSYQWYHHSSKSLYWLLYECRDMLFVASAGNEGTNNDERQVFPASYLFNNIIAVAATNQNDQLADFPKPLVASNYGAKSVDIGAPGLNIVSASHPASTFGNPYVSLSGTSMAAPFVTGAAGLVKAACPSLSAVEIKRLLMETADPAPALQGKTVSGGRLNAYKALRRCAYAAPTPTPRPAATPTPRPTSGPTPTPQPMPTQTPSPSATPAPRPTTTPTPRPATACGTDDAEAGWYFVYQVTSTGSCGGLIGTPWIGGDTAKVEVEFRNGIRPASAWCVPGRAKLTIVTENGHWYYTCALTPAGNEQVYAQWRW